MRWALPLLVVLVTAGCFAPEHVDPPPADEPLERGLLVPAEEEPPAEIGRGLRAPLLPVGEDAFRAAAEAARVLWLRPDGGEEPLLRPGEELQLRLDLGFPVSVPVETVARIEWDLGDGTTEQGGLVRHAWSAPGSHAVTVRATSLRERGLAFEATVLVGVLHEEARNGTIPLPDDGRCVVPGTTCVDLPFAVGADARTLVVRSEAVGRPRAVVTLVAPNGTAFAAAPEHALADPEAGLWSARVHLAEAAASPDHPFGVGIRVLPATTLSDGNRDAPAPAAQARGRSV